jgi:hypothetical protein
MGTDMGMATATALPSMDVSMMRRAATITMIITMILMITRTTMISMMT